MKTKMKKIKKDTAGKEENNNHRKINNIKEREVVEIVLRYVVKLLSNNRSYCSTT